MLLIQQVFNVVINGNVVLDNFDVLAQVSPETALDKTFPIAVTDNTIEIDFSSRFGNAIVSAIQITPSAAPAS